MSVGQTISINDVLATSYRTALPVPEPTCQDTALLLIDIQHLAEPSYLAKTATAAGLPRAEVDEALKDYSDRFHSAVENCRKVLAAAREAGVPPIHVKIQALSHQARDTSSLHKRLGWKFAPGDPATEFLPQTAPIADEIIITKTASGAFAGTALDSTLRNMGIEHLFICGFVADECVETTARVALDLGYRMKIVGDATTTYHREAADFSVGKFKSLGFTADSDEIVALFKGMK